MSFDISVGVGPSLPKEGQATPRPYELIAFPFPPGHFLVHSFRGVEGMSAPYAFDVTVTSALDPSLDLETLLLGQRAAFFIRASGVPRAIHGVIRSVRSEGTREQGRRSQHRLRLVPGFELLRHNRRSRIFQNMSVPEVVEQVTPGLPTRWLLSRDYPKRAYITQYEETDKDFVERLLAEAGIFYYFAQPSAFVRQLADMATDALEKLGPLGQAVGAVGEMVKALLEREIMVFGDAADAHTPLDDGGLVQAIATPLGLPTSVSLGPVKVAASSPTLSYFDQPGLAVERFDKVTAFIPVRSLRTTHSEFREYDPDRPNTVLGGRSPGLEESLLGAAADALVAEVSLDPTRGADALQGSIAMDWSALVPKQSLENYDHHGRFHFPDWADAGHESGRILARSRRKAHVAKGSSLCTALTPGSRFQLDQHPIGNANREYVVTRVHHRGATGHVAASRSERYTNRFECVPAEVVYPPIHVQRTTIQATLTATVVGPPSEEIFVDAQGRIKVHFHWDRDSASEHSSCWIRTMQSWGGASWGTQFIPRVGMEVVVAFDGGDPDKPMVIGSLYNATHPMPFALPGDKTRSGIRTQTVHGIGANELSFEDRKDGEQIFLHAQRDLDEVVEHDHTSRVLHDETSRVGHNRREEVGLDAVESIGKHQRLTVGGDRTTAVEGSRIDTTRHDHHQRVTGRRSARIEGGEGLDVSGNADLHYADNVLTRIDGHAVMVVGRHEQKASHVLHVEGTNVLSATDALELVSEREIVFRVGKSCIRIGKDRIDFSSAAVGTQGGGAGLEASKDGLKLSSDGPAQLVSQDLIIKTRAASLAMASEVRLDGSRILLNAPDKAQDEKKELEPKTRIELVDQEGNALAHERYLIVGEDGGERSGVLGEDGTIELDLLAGGQITFPDLYEVTN